MWKVLLCSALIATVLQVLAAPAEPQENRFDQFALLNVNEKCKENLFYLQQQVVLMFDANTEMFRQVSKNVEELIDCFKGENPGVCAEKAGANLLNKMYSVANGNYRIAELFAFTVGDIIKNCIFAGNAQS